MLIRGECKVSVAEEQQGRLKTTEASTRLLQLHFYLLLLFHYCSSPASQHEYMKQQRLCIWWTYSPCCELCSKKTSVTVLSGLSCVKIFCFSTKDFTSKNQKLCLFILWRDFFLHYIFFVKHFFKHMLKSKTSKNTTNISTAFSKNTSLNCILFHFLINFSSTAFSAFTSAHCRCWPSTDTSTVSTDMSTPQLLLRSYTFAVFADTSIPFSAYTWTHTCTLTDTLVLQLTHQLL